ncbi:MAG: sulfotransferase family protein [Nocardioides sp.]
MSQPSAPQRAQVLLVVGPGRSGTSAVTGSLAHSGYHVPSAIKARDSNPRGFYEPRWLVNFDKELLAEAKVTTLDRDPLALEAMAQVLGSGDAKARLVAWVREQLENNNRLVLKDPRLVWFHALWAEVAEELDFDLGFLIMLRHPSEVSSSRSAYYGAEHVRAVAGWTHVALMAEQVTRGARRAFVHYPDLVGDWRKEFRRVDGLLGLDLVPQIDTTPHPIDEFLDPALRRMAPGWDGIAVPSWLSDLADRSFDALKGIADDGEPSDYTALDALRAEYAETFEATVIIARSRNSHQHLVPRAEDAQPAAEPDAAASTAAPSARPAARRGLRDLLRRS